MKRFKGRHRRLLVYLTVSTTVFFVVSPGIALADEIVTPPDATVVAPAQDATVVADPVPDPIVTVDPVPDPIVTVDPVPDPIVTVDPVPDPIVTFDPAPDATVDPAPAATVDPAPDATVDPAPRSVSDPIADQVPPVIAEPAPDPVSEAASGPTPETATEPFPEVVSDPIPDVVGGPAPETATEPFPEVVSDPIPDVVTDIPTGPAPETATEPFPEIVTDPLPELVTDPLPELVTDPLPELVMDPILVPIAEALPAAIAEPILLQIAEVIPAPIAIPPEAVAPVAVDETPTTATATTELFFTDDGALPRITSEDLPQKLQDDPFNSPQHEGSALTSTAIVLMSSLATTPSKAGSVQVDDPSSCSGFGSAPCGVRNSPNDPGSFVQSIAELLRQLALTGSGALDLLKLALILAFVGAFAIWGTRRRPVVSVIEPKKTLRSGDLLHRHHRAMANGSDRPSEWISVPHAVVRQRPTWRISLATPQLEALAFAGSTARRPGDRSFVADSMARVSICPVATDRSAQELVPVHRGNGR